MKENDHPYNEFLAGQKQRESAWKASRETKRAKVQSQTTTPTMSQGDDIQEDLVAVLRQQLTAKTEECRRLMSRLDSLEEVNAKIIRNQSDMQENFLKVRFFRFWGGSKSPCKIKVRHTLNFYFLNTLSLAINLQSSPPPPQRKKQNKTRFVLYLILLSLLSQTLENMEASVTAIGDKTTTAVSSLMTKLSTMLDNVQATTSAVSSLEKRLDFLEEQGVNQFTMVRLF